MLGVHSGAFEQRRLLMVVLGRVFGLHTSLMVDMNQGRAYCFILGNGRLGGWLRSGWGLCRCLCLWLGGRLLRNLSRSGLAHGGNFRLFFVATRV